VPPTLFPHIEVERVSVDTEVERVSVTKEFTEVIALGSIGKKKKVAIQPYESFIPTGKFSNVMETGETISEKYVTAVDSDGEDATADVLAGNVTIYNDDDDNPWKIGDRFSGGVAASSPYKLTFRIVTSLANKWEVDMLVEVKET
jgi:hypothetical protein